MYRMGLRMVDTTLYTLSAIAIVMCVVVAPFQLVYVSRVLPEQANCYVYMLSLTAFFSLLFWVMSCFYIYLIYLNKKRMYEAIRESMRWLGTILFVLFGFILLVMYLRIQLNVYSESTFRSAMSSYNNDTTAQDYINSTQTLGKCCGFEDMFDWAGDLPLSCCPDSTIEPPTTATSNSAMTTSNNTMTTSNNTMTTSNNTCYRHNAYKKCCKSYFSSLITAGTQCPFIVTSILDTVSVAVYILIMAFLELSNTVGYEPLPGTSTATARDDSITGTHTSWPPIQSSPVIQQI